MVAKPSAAFAEAFDRRDLNFKDKNLSAWAEVGIAIHHAGLDHDDRRKIEEAYRNGQIKAIFATSTLAVGVNLPAHAVFLAGTFVWDGAGELTVVHPPLWGC